MTTAQKIIQKTNLGFLLKNRQKSAKKHYIEKQISVNFVNLSTILV